MMNNERIKNQNEMNKRGEIIARTLGGTYKAPTGEVWIARGNIVLATGESFHMALNEREGRITVSANWPSDSKNRVYYPRNYDKTDYKSITVDANKSPERIAKDIQTRFLPGFLPEYNKQATRAAGSDDYAAMGQRGIARLAEAYGVLPPGGDVTEISLNLGGYHGSAECCGKSAHINLRGLTVEQAKQVLKLVATFA